MKYVIVALALYFSPSLCLGGHYSNYQPRQKFAEVYPGYYSYYYTVGTQLGRERTINEIKDDIINDEQFLESIVDRVLEVIGDAGEIPGETIPEEPTQPENPDTTLLGVMTTSCVNCHGPSSANKQFFVDNNGNIELKQDLTAKDFYKMWRYTTWDDEIPENLRMPKNAQEPLDKSKTELFRKKFEDLWNK